MENYSPSSQQPSKFPLYQQGLLLLSFLRLARIVTSLPETLLGSQKQLVIPPLHSQKPLLQALKALYHYPCTYAGPPLDC